MSEADDLRLFLKEWRLTGYYTGFLPDPNLYGFVSTGENVGSKWVWVERIVSGGFLVQAGTYNPAKYMAGNIEEALDKMDKVIRSWDG